jgi:hypothetical protein
MYTQLMIAYCSNIQDTCRRGVDSSTAWQASSEAEYRVDTDTQARHGYDDAQHAHRLEGTDPHDEIPSSRSPGDSIVATTSSRINGDSACETLLVKEPNDREVIDAATILEFLAWGRRKQVDFASALPSCEIEPLDTEPAPSDRPAWWPTPDGHTAKNDTLAHMQILLPDRRKTYELVRYHLDSLLWYHCSFHGPTFLRQLDTFYDKNQGQIDDVDVDTQWVALLFAVIAATMCCATTSVVRGWGFKSAEQATLSQQWLQATVKCLDAARYMANSSISSCQAVATLTMSAHLLGFSNQQAVLLASVTRIAQSLGLHRLDEASDRIIEVEAGRRLWSQLCTQDWFSITFAECYLISPLHTCSISPLHCDDESLEDVSAQTPTITSYCRYLYSIASLMPRLQDSVESCNTLFTKYEQVLTFDRAVRELATQKRPVFLSGVPIEPDWPVYVNWARSAAAISTSHKIIMVHRKFLSLSFTNTAFAFTRRTCIAASKTILKEFERTVADGGPVLWIYHAFSVAAAITLCLEMLHSGSTSLGYQEHHQLVMSTIRLLKKAETSKIATRGVWLLAKLMNTIPTAGTANRAHSAGKRPLPTPADNLQGSTKRQRAAEFLNAVRSCQESSEPPSETNTAVDPADQNVRTPVSSSTSRLDTNTSQVEEAVDFGFEDDGYRNLAASSFSDTDDLFKTLNAGLAGGTVDTFESLLSLTHNYDSTI